MELLEPGKSLERRRGEAREQRQQRCGCAHLTVQKLSITGGKITVSGTASKAKPSVYSDVNLEASDLSTTSSFPFKLTATGPGNAAIKVDGKAGPIDQADTSLTPLAANVDVQHLDLATTGFIDPSSGIAGVMDFKGDLSSDGKDMKSKGNVTLNKFKMSAAGAPSSVPVSVDYTTNYTLKTQAGVLSQGDIHIGKALQQLTGTYNLANDPASLNMKVNASNMPLGDLEGFLPAVGVVLPSGSKLQGRNIEREPFRKRSYRQVDDCGSSEHFEHRAGRIQLEPEARRAFGVHGLGLEGRQLERNPDSATLRTDSQRSQRHSI